MFNELVSLFAPLTTVIGQFSYGKFIELLFLLFFGHCLADFAFQSQAMAEAKSSFKNPREVWIPVMTGHCMIHAGIVFLITGKIWLAVYEFTVHFIIDDLKCKGKLANGPYAFAKDQVLHIFDLVIIAVLFYIF